MMIDAPQMTAFGITCYGCKQIEIVFEPKITHMMIDARFATKLPNGWRAFIKTDNGYYGIDKSIDELISTNNCFCPKCSEEIEIIQVLE